MACKVAHPHSPRISFALFLMNNPTCAIVPKAVIELAVCLMCFFCVVFFPSQEEKKTVPSLPGIGSASLETRADHRVTAAGSAQRCDVTYLIVADG